MSDIEDIWLIRLYFFLCCLLVRNFSAFPLSRSVPTIHVTRKSCTANEKVDDNMHAIATLSNLIRPNNFLLSSTQRPTNDFPQSLYVFNRCLPLNCNYTSIHLLLHSFPFFTILPFINSHIPPEKAKIDDHPNTIIALVYLLYLYPHSHFTIYHTHKHQSNSFQTFNFYTHAIDDGQSSNSHTSYAGL